MKRYYAGDRGDLTAVAGADSAAVESIYHLHTCIARGCSQPPDDDRIRRARRRRSDHRPPLPAVRGQHDRRAERPGYRRCARRRRSRVTLSRCAASSRRGRSPRRPDRDPAVAARRLRVKGIWRDLIAIPSRACEALRARGASTSATPLSSCADTAAHRACMRSRRFVSAPIRYCCRCQLARRSARRVCVPAYFGDEYATFRRQRAARQHFGMLPINSLLP